MIWRRNVMLWHRNVMIWYPKKSLDLASKSHGGLKTQHRFGKTETWGLTPVSLSHLLFPALHDTPRFRKNDESFRESIPSLVHPFVSQCVRPLVSQSINQSVGRSVSQLVSQSINQSFSQPINQSINQLIN